MKIVSKVAAERTVLVAVDEDAREEQHLTTQQFENGAACSSFSGHVTTCGAELAVYCKHCKHYKLASRERGIVPLIPKRSTS